MSLDILLSVLGEDPKSLIIDRTLSSSINALIPFSRLKQRANLHNVYWFQDSLNVTIDTSMTFLIRSELQNISLLDKRIKELMALNEGVQIDVVITDDYARSFKHEMERVGILGEIFTVKEWKLWLDLDGMMSLNLKQLESLYLYKTPSSPFKLASLLNEHLKRHPEMRITQILSKGLNSSKFVQIFKDLRENEVSQMSMEEKREFLKIEHGLYEKLSSGKQCDLIVLERNLDFMSVVLPQLSYSGVIDEIAGIDVNTIVLDDETIYLSLGEESGDNIYDSLKYMNFGMACDYLNTEAKSLQSQYDLLVKRVEVSSNLVSELQQLEFLKKEVSTHTKISESILQKISDSSRFNELLELHQNIILQNIGYSTSVSKVLDLIYQLFPVNDILRLLSIVSIVFGGLREKDFQSLSNEIIESYGIKYLLVLQNLLKVGVLSIRGDPSIIKNFNSLNSAMHLLPSDGDPDDLLANVMAYRGYVPLVARILEKTLSANDRASWRDVDLSSILGKVVDERMVKDVKLGGALQKNSTVFIVMIGGITHSELAAIRQFEERFEKKYGVKKSVVVLTDGFVNAGDLLKSVGG